MTGRGGRYMSGYPVSTQNDEGDILYVQLSDEPIARTREYGDECLVDFDAAGGIVGAEFIMIDEQFDLTLIPAAERFADAVRSYLATRA